MAVNGALFLVSATHQGVLSLQQLRVIVKIIYPINISQSCLTTGLIMFKIGRQYFASRAAGLSAKSSGVGLLTIMRAIVESTVLFTVQQAVMCILFYFNQPTHYIFFWTLIPSIGKCVSVIQTTTTNTSSAYAGVAFALLTIRVHEVRNGPNPSIRVPELEHRFEARALASNTFSTLDQELIHHRQGRSHRRTLSDGCLSSPFARSTTGQDCHTWGPVNIRAGDSEHPDLEKGNARGAASSPNAVLAMNYSTKVFA